MTISGGVHAWVTAAVEDKTVDKAIVLAGSLRRVRTAKKLAVFTTLAVSKDLREKLKEVFDLVVFLEQEVPNGLNLEDYAKVQGFSLQIFNKCVYVSPEALILKNCDEIFEKYAIFAACGDENGVDPTVYVFTPSLDQSRALEKIVHYVDVAGEKAKGDFSKYFNLWMKNHIPKSERLDRKYNLEIDLENFSRKSMEVDVIIANFKGVHPLTLSENALKSKLEQLGCIEKYAVQRCLEIYRADVLHNVNEIKDDYLPQKEQYVNEPIAIVGMSFRLPGGNNVQEFWDLLANGKDAIQSVPSFRWRREHTITPCKNRNYQAGFLNVPIDEFDAKFFGISPKEAVFLDPQQRFLHEITWEAIEDAMIDPLTLHGTQTGVFVGSWLSDYKDIAVRSPDIDFFRIYMGNSIASEASRLSHFFGITGPSIATESGCSSAIVAVHMACNSLRKNETNIALACGVNLLLHPQDIMSLVDTIVAPDGRCKTFDENANGFGRAEACAVLVMKRYSDAIKDEDNIWGLIRGSGVSQEGVSKSIGTPTVHCESLAMELALKDANLHPKDVSYIEAHGTGTTVGDPLEVAAIEKAYSDNERKEKLFIGSVKTNVGHTESVSGITGIIKVLLSMKNETIPPHLNLKTLNPDINLEAIPAEIPLSAIPWPKMQNKPRFAGVSSFGITGTDGHVVLQEPPTIPQSKIDFQQERPLHIIKFSAKCQESLDEMLSKYETIFSEKAESGNERDFADISYSANFGRSTFNHRAILVAKNFTEAAKIIRDKIYKHADVQANGNQLCFLFTGQGSQYQGMARSLFLTSPIFKDNFDKCSEVLQQRYHISIKDVLWGNSNNGDELSRTLYSQTSIFCVEYCLLKLWESWGVKPDYVMGHSLGEFAAAVAAEAISFDDALMLVAERSRLIDNLPRGKMLVIRADKKTVDQTIAKYRESHPEFWVDFAAVNTPDQTVVAGDSAFVENFSKFCGEKQLNTIILAATHAFHSRHMNPMLEAYRKVASTVKPPAQANDNAPKYISGMEGKLIKADAIDADYWVRHTREKVSFIDACKVAQGEGCSLFLEVGPHPVLSAMTMMNIEGQSVTCLPSLRRKENEWVTLLESLSKLFLTEWKGDIDWKGFDRFYSRKRVDIPFYPFNRKPIWIKTRAILGELHPLLGKLLPNATGFSVFEQDMTLKKADFAQDHVIGNTVVFPGAGFLEMCLAGGHCCVQAFGETFMQPRRPILLKDLKIKAPMALLDSQQCVLQTVVTLDETDEDEVGYNVQIYRLDESSSSGGGQWISHASAKFFPVVPTLPSEISKFNVEDAIQSWEKTDNNKDFYEKLPEVGLRFGPKFQSLQSGWRSETGALIQLKVPDGTEPFIIHPVMADAMLQAAMLWNYKDNKVKRKLQVPVHVGEFIWLEVGLSNLSETAGRYVFCGNNADGSTYSLLLNEKGVPLAYMNGIDFAETTAKLIEGMILQQTASLPELWEEIWKSRVGPMQKRLEIEPLDPPTDETQKKFHEYNLLNGEEQELFQTLQWRAPTYLLDGLYKLGWDPKSGEIFTVTNLLDSLSIQHRFYKYIGFFLHHLCGFGYLNLLNELDSFCTTADLPTHSAVTNRLNEPVCPSLTQKPEYRLMFELWSHLPEILTGEADALTYIFPTDPSRPNAQEFYNSQAIFAETTSSGVNITYFLPALQQLQEKYLKSKNETAVLRILEIGAGTGCFTKAFVDRLMSLKIDTEYYFTDISAAFFGPAEKFLKDNVKSVVFKKFNMEEDPFQQGFVPEYFDMIVACEVLHVSKQIRPMLQRLRCLLKPCGIFQIYETVVPCPRITFMFGLLDGYWLMEDFDLRPNHITMSTDRWTSALKSSGFASVISIPAYNSVHAFMIAQATEEHVGDIALNYIGKPTYSWVIFSDEPILANALKNRLAAINRKVLIVSKPAELTESSLKDLIKSSFNTATEDVKELEGIIYLWGMSSESHNNDQSHIALPLVTIVQHVLTMEKLPRICVNTHGIYSVNGSDVLNPHPGTLVGLVRAIRNEYTMLRICQIDLDVNEPAIKQLDEMFYNIWTENYGVVAFSEQKLLVPKLAQCKTPNDYLSLPNGCDRFQLVLPQTRMISDLEFSYLDPYILGERDVEVKVKTMALNFRDVFCVIKPLPIFEQMNTVGLDFAGVVSRVGSAVSNVKVGDRVIGMNTSENLSLPSHIKIDEKLVANLPADMTLNEGVTLPAVFSTSVYCLINVAKIKRGDTILIHTASGGVGLCAIQLAKEIGANIIATAGSTRKRNFLRNLGIQHVFNSRTTDFGAQILEATSGRGVDIVLNSITGPGFKEASLGALAKNGRFIEMSKLSVWKEEEVQELRPDVFYRVVDLTSLEKSQYEELSCTLKEYLKENSIQPIPYERFDALNIRGALNYLQKAKHIGKIVCVMPEVKVGKSKLIATTPLFNEDSTYLVTGGLGGIGFEVVKWMLTNGAKHVAIASRSHPKSELLGQMDMWNKNGKHVEAFAVDVGNFEQCKKLFEKLNDRCSGFPRVKGVMHAAGILADATLENQSWERFQQVLHAKVNGSSNLHHLTKNLLLEHFVLFSSVAAAIGNPGQTNHSAANSFEDTLSYYRKSIGLPSTNINWGNWGEVGVATEIDLPGVRPISTKQGLLALETFLKLQVGRVSVLNVDSFGTLSKLMPGLKTYVDDKRLLGETKYHVVMNSDEFWVEVDSAPSREEKVDVFKSFIKSTVKFILKMDENEEIDDNMEFPALGLDSLIMLEMKNAMQNVLGSRITLTAAQLKDCNNTLVLANRLVDIYEGEGEKEINLPTTEELHELVREDSELPDKVNVPDGRSHKCIDEIEAVLLTGVTGNLGPYLLRDLTQRPQIKKVYCLIRKMGKNSPSERLKSKLELSNLQTEVNMEKVECIQGDVTDARLGLSEEEYNKLALEVDAICHSAVRADHTAKYWKAPPTKKNNIRTVNVLGTVHILQFATSFALKHVYYASTLLSVQAVDEDGCVSEDWQDIGAFDDVLKFNPGYPLSKYISEQIIKQGVERGIPIKAFRFPAITGDSRTGRSDFEMNHIILRWLAYMKLGCIPDIPTPLPLLPVDHCATISLDAFFHPKASYSDVYNVFMRKICLEQTIIEVARDFNLEVEPVPFAEFFQKLKLEGEDSPLAPFKQLYDEEGSTYYEQMLNSSTSYAKKFIENSENFYRSRKLLAIKPNYEENLDSSYVIMKRDLQYLKDLGVFKRFGINC